MTQPLFKHWSAWTPIVLSLIALALILATIAIVGLPATPPEDEGTGAHLFQLWLVLEAVMIALFALTWLPKVPEQAGMLLIFQILAAAAACAPVFYFNL